MKERPVEEISNKQLAKILYEMAALWEMEGIEFKPRAYEKAAEGVETHGQELQESYRRDGFKAITGVPGIGKGIAKHIEEIFKTGKFEEYEKFKKRIPVDISQLMQIQGLGPKMIKALWDNLKIRNLRELEKAANEGKIRKLSRFGEKSEQKILKAIEFLKQSGGRRILGAVLPEIRNLESTIAQIPEVKQAKIAGSVRRMKETIGDIDVLATSAKPERVMEAFLALPFIDYVYGKGPTKTSVRLKNGMDADLRIVPDESFGAALCYFTGSQDHNIALREASIKKGWKLSEYGLFEGERMIAGATEHEIYQALGLQYIEPEMREYAGELELSRKKKLPKLIGYQDLKGDLQTQTTWTDGEDSIEKMADQAEKIGLEYIAITDHTKSLAMTGMDENKLLEQMAYIDDLNRKLKAQGRKFRILKGAEVNIMKDGSLDMPDEILSKLDVVGAAIHHYFSLSSEDQTLRYVRAMENPNVDIIFHLTCRLLTRREPIQINVDQVIQTALRTRTVLEIDSSPNRLDMKDEYIRRCVQAGVKMTIDSDAHSISELGYLEFGIGQARRGWAEKRDIINTLPVKQFLCSLKSGG